LQFHIHSDPPIGRCIIYEVEKASLSKVRNRLQLRQKRVKEVFETLVPAGDQIPTSSVYEGTARAAVLSRRMFVLRSSM